MVPRGRLGLDVVSTGRRHDRGVPAYSRPSVTSNFVAVLSGQVAAWMITSLTFIGIPRFFGPEGAGVLSLGFAYAVVISLVASLGLGTILTKETARDVESVAEWFPAALIAQITLGLIAAGIVMAVLALTGASASRVAVVGVYCLNVPSLQVALSAGAILQGLERMKVAAVYDIVTKGLVLSTLLVAILADATPLEFAILSNVAMLLVAQHQLRRVMRLVDIRPSWVRLPQLTMIARKSLPFATVTVIFAVYQSADVMILGFIADDAEVGFYAAPLRIFGAMLFVPIAIATVVFPRLSAAHEVESGRFDQLCVRSICIGLLSSFGLALLAIGMGPTVLTLLLGGEFADSRAVILIFAIMLIPTSVSTIAGRAGFASEKQSYMWKVGAVCLAAKLALTPLFVTVFAREYANAAAGAALALLVVEVLMCAGMLRVFPRAVLLESRQVVTTATCSAVAAIASTVFARMIVGDVTATLLGMLLYVVLLISTHTVSIPEVRLLLRDTPLGRAFGARP